MYEIAKRRIVMFDFDGTLADTKRAIVDTATAALLDFGLERERLGDVDDSSARRFPRPSARCMDSRRRRRRP